MMTISMVGYETELDLTDETNKRLVLHLVLLPAGIHLSESNLL